MGIFDKIKDMRAMQQQANQIKAMLSQERVSGSSKAGATISWNGNQEDVSIELSDALVPDRDTRIKIANAMREAMADLMKQHAKMVQSKFGSMLGE